LIAPNDEQETIISYDKETDSWHYYSNCPKHNHKWDALVKPSRREMCGDRIAILEGEVIGNVIVSKKRKITDAQRQAMAERAKARFYSKY
jgi:hypothetical protein